MCKFFHSHTFPTVPYSQCVAFLFATALKIYIFFLFSSNDGTEFAGSIYQKVNSNLETAVNLAWTAGSNNTRFGIGAKYQLDKDAYLSVSNWSKVFFVFNL